MMHRKYEPKDRDVMELEGKRSVEKVGETGIYIGRGGGEGQGLQGLASHGRAGGWNRADDK